MPTMDTLAPDAIPETTLRITSPRTSSITAAPMMIRASWLDMRPRSESTRAVIPTEVAVSVAPMKMACGDAVARRDRRRVGQVRPVDVPERKGHNHPDGRDSQSEAGPTRNISRRSVSRPISKSSNTTPSSASTCTTSAAGPAAGTIPEPRRRGRPRRRAPPARPAAQAARPARRKAWRRRAWPRSRETAARCRGRLPRQAGGIQAGL